MSGYDASPQPKSRTGIWMMTIAAACACLVIVCCGLSGTTVGIGQEQGWVSDDAAPLIGLPTLAVGAVIVGLCVGVAEVGLWLRLAKRGLKIVVSLVLALAGLVAIPAALGTIALVSRLVPGINEMPVSLLVGAPATMFVIFVTSLSVGLLAGPVLLIISLIKRDS
jgi:hypothetical protein